MVGAVLEADVAAEVRLLEITEPGLGLDDQALGARDAFGGGCAAAGRPRLAELDVAGEGRGPQTRLGAPLASRATLR